MRFTLALSIGAALPLVAECQDPDQAQVDHGRELYARTCAVCHGTRGEGYVADRAPALANQELLASASDGFFVRAIDRGRSGTTMSAFGKTHGGPFESGDEVALVAFMRTWQTAPHATLDERALLGDATRGAVTYAERCAQCHGPNGQNGRYEAVANPELLAAASNGFLRYAIARGRPSTPMSAYEGALSSQDIDDLVAALRSWQKPAAAPDAGTPPPSLGQIVLYPSGADPTDFVAFPGYTPVDVVKADYDAKMRFGIVDARAPSDYVTGHIAGAVSVAYYDPGPFLSQLPKDVWLACYCACPHAESGALAQKLLDAGFTKVAVLDEGFLEWQSRGYPVHAGAMP